MTDPWKLSATDLAASIRNRELSVREATRSALDRLAAVNPRINAVVEHRPDEALARADALDARLAAGEDIGPLGGVPVTIKVNVDQKGYPTTNGVRLQQALVAEVNSPVVDALEHAGAVPIGRTNTPAFSYRWFTDNQLHGKTFNPRDRSLTPGGSSGGAAAAVAAGIGAIGHGTDIAGSVRYPAYACGIHGLRPSLGRVAAFNATTGDRAIGPQLMAVSGPIARTIPDLRLALEAMSAPSSVDPWWTPAPLIGPAVARRVALCTSPDGMPVAPEVVAALHDAAARLRDAGWSVEEVQALPPLAEAATLQVKLWMGDGFDAQLATAMKEGDPGALVALRGQAQAVQGLDAATLSSILLQRSACVRAWNRLFDDYPVVLLPVSGEPPFPDSLDVRDEASRQRVWQAQVPQVAIPFMGLPGLAVTTSMNGSVPIGVQLVAARFREDLLLAAGEDIETRGAQVTPIEDPA